MNLSNIITEMIMDMLSQEDEIEFQRNLLAQEVGCVPSQINYVLSSRFTPERGYIVESRRGGGGCVRITKIGFDEATGPRIRLINSIGDEIDENTTRLHIQNLLYRRLISERDAMLILSAVNENNFRMLHPSMRGSVRASILKQMLLCALNQ